MLDRWFILLLFLSFASHYLPVGWDPSRGPEPVTKASKVSGSSRDLPLPPLPGSGWATSLYPSRDLEPWGLKKVDSAQLAGGTDFSRPSSVSHRSPLCNEDAFPPTHPWVSSEKATVEDFISEEIRIRDHQGPSCVCSASVFLPLSFLLRDDSSMYDTWPHYWTGGA